MSRKTMRAALIGIAIAALLGGCSTDPYPLPFGPPNATLHNPAAIGEPNRAVLIYLEVRPGDQVELLGAEATGSLDGARVRFLVSYPVIAPDGSYLIGETFVDLEGAVAAASEPERGPRNTVGIAAELTAEEPGRFEVTNVRLRYRLNGRPEQVGEGIDVVWTVCADEPAPTDCPT